MEKGTASEAANVMWLAAQMPEAPCWSCSVPACKTDLVGSSQLAVALGSLEPSVQGRVEKDLPCVPHNLSGELTRSHPGACPASVSPDPGCAPGLTSSQEPVQW